MKSGLNNKKRTGSKAWSMVSCLSAIVALSILLYFGIIYFFRPGILSGESFFIELPAETPEIMELDNNFVITELKNFLSVEKIMVRSNDSGKYFKLYENTGPDLFELMEHVTAGDELYFEIYIKNNSSSTMDTFSIIDSLPVKFINIKYGPDPGASYDPFSKKITWTINGFKAGEVKVLKFYAQVPKDSRDLDKFENRLLVVEGGSTAREIFLRGVIDAIPDYSFSEIKVTDLNGGDIWAEDIIEYSIRIKNNGMKNGRNIVLTCPIPASTGYIPGTASGAEIKINNDSTILEFLIDRLEIGKTKDVSFKIYIAKYLTFEDEIKSEFSIKDDNMKVELKNPVFTVRPEAFQTVVCMGDSQILVTEWPEILDGLLENQFPHAEFNTISSGVSSEMAVDAITRFDKDVRIYNPDIIILGYGSNDAGAMTVFYEYHMDILIRQALSTGAKVFVHGVGSIDTSLVEWNDKTNYREFNEILKERLCPKYGAVYIDIYKGISGDPGRYLRKDGIHWNEEGADLVAHESFKAIVNCLDSNGKLLETPGA